MHEARYCTPLEGNAVRCDLCPHDCRIRDGGHGVCAVRYNRQGQLFTLVYDRVAARAVDPVEKKPLFHFHPGSTAYSIGTVGCNLRCRFCQNWQISQWLHEHLPKKAHGDKTDAPTGPSLQELQDRVPGEPVTPASIVTAALASGATSIAYTYTEPTVFYELAYDTAVLARARGLKNIFVTNGFINEAPLRDLVPVLDAANVDLKFFRDERYRHISGARLQPILDAIRLYRELGVWVEVTTLVVPGLNDSDEELRDIAQFVHSVDPDMPWHVSQFYPGWKMLDTPVTPVDTLRRAAAIGRTAGLRYVYEGNVPGERGESTWCFACGTKLITRYGLRMLENRIKGSACPACGAAIAGVGLG